MKSLEQYSRQSRDASLSAFDREMALANALIITCHSQIASAASTLPPVKADRTDATQWLRSHFAQNYIDSIFTDEHISVSAYNVASKLIEKTAPRMPLLALAAALDRADELMFCQAVAIWLIYGKALPKVVKELINCQ